MSAPARLLTPQQPTFKRHVRFRADFVCFTPKSRHSEAHAGLPLLTHSGHHSRYGLRQR